MVQTNFVIQTAFLGDLILAVPLLKRIKKLYPGDELAVLCKKGLGEFLLREKIADRVIEVEKSDAKSYGRALAQARELRIRNIYCTHRSFRSLIFSARLKAEKKIAFKSLAGWLVFDDMVDFIPGNPEAIRQFKILETTDPETAGWLRRDYSGLNVASAAGALPPVPEFFSFPVIEKVPAAKKRIGIFPGSVWATKRWTTEGFTELVRKFVNGGYEVDLLGGSSERELCEAVAGPGARVLAGTMSIAESLKGVKDYALIVANDSAPTHMAAYNGIPVLTLFGPTVPAQGFRPWSDKAAIVENREMSCRPCGRHGHDLCPLGHHDCMKTLTADLVFERAERLLS